MVNSHRNILTNPEIVKDTFCIKKLDKVKKKKIYEAQTILKEKPSINIFRNVFKKELMINFSLLRNASQFYSIIRIIPKSFKINKFLS